MGKADLHCHTNFSGVTQFLRIPFPESVTPPEKMVDKAIKSNLDVLSITDHDEIKGAFRAKNYAQQNKLEIDVVISEEITTSDGELLGLFLEELIPPGKTVEESIDLIHEQGGLAIAPHPYSYHCPSLGDKIKTLNLDGVETLNGFHRDPYVNKLAEQNALASLAQVGGSDAHSAILLGMTYTEFMGRSGDELYHCIKKRQTKPGGNPAYLRQCILWSMEIPYVVMKTLLTPWKNNVLANDEPLKRLSCMKNRNKAVALCGCLLYVGTPLPYICGVISEGVTRYKAKKKWCENSIKLIDKL
jgi:predicted metal-dependent phosphoesterase TrpH